MRVNLEQYIPVWGIDSAVNEFLDTREENRIIGAKSLGEIVRGTTNYVRGGFILVENLGTLLGSAYLLMNYFN